MLGRSRAMDRAKGWFRRSLTLLAGLLLPGCEPPNTPGQVHCISVGTATGTGVLGIDERYLDSDVWDEEFYISFHWKDLSPHQGLGYNLDSTGHLQVLRKAPRSRDGAEDFTNSGLRKLVDPSEIKGWSKFVDIYGGSVTYVPGKKAPHIHHASCIPVDTACVVYLRTPVFNGAVEIPKARIAEAKNFADRTEEMMERFRRAATTSCRRDFVEERNRPNI